MTYVGKILVIIIMVFALIFLGITTVVFTTETNWKKARDEARAEVKKTQDQLSTAKGEAASLKDQLAKEDASHKAALRELELRLASLDQENKQRQNEITEARKELETALANSKISGEESQASRKETEQLRETLASVQDQANALKLQQTDLNDRIRVLERELDVAKTNNRDLRERVALYSTVLRRHNISADLSQIRQVDNPPDVEGKVLRVNERNSRVEISIGSDDGLVQGNTLHLYRLRQPNPGYIGKIQLDLVDPDRATGHLIGGTMQGRKIMEGDYVTTKIRPRG